MNKAWPFALNFLIFAAVAFIAPFLVLYYQSLGFSGTQIGILAGLTPLVTVVSAPFWTGLADQTRRHRLILSVALFMSVVILIVVPGFSAFAPISLLIVLLNAFYAPVSSFLPYLKELGAAEAWMGVMLTIGTLSEIPVLFFGNRLLQRFNANGLLRLAMIITGLRLVALAIVRTPEAAWLLQLINGLTFPAMWIAGVAYADQYAPPGMRATAQGLFGAMVFGLGLAIGGFVGGPLLENWGGQALFLIFGAVVLSIVISVALLQKRWHIA
jgi:MFS family permease